MRLRYLLPAAEIAVSVAFVFVPLWSFLPNYRVKGPDGREIVCHDNCPPLLSLCGIDPVTFAWEVNRPAVVVVLLILSAKWDSSQDGHDYFYDPVWRGAGFGLSGIIVWFFVGRFFDDLITWRRTQGSAKDSDTRSHFCSEYIGSGDRDSNWNSRTPEHPALRSSMVHLLEHLLDFDRLFRCNDVDLSIHSDSAEARLAASNQAPLKAHSVT
jgi:hypothetical protein